MNKILTGSIFFCTPCFQGRSYKDRGYDDDGGSATLMQWPVPLYDDDRQQINVIQDWESDGTERV